MSPEKSREWRINVNLGACGAGRKPMYALSRVVEKFGIFSAWVYAAWLNFSDLVREACAEPGWVSTAALAIGVFALLLVLIGVVYSRRVLAKNSEQRGLTY